MSNEQLLIPKKIKVGFQKRGDTYTGNLGYVIYYDAKGKLRKEGSWQGWRHKNIDPLDLENVPTEGFVLNRDVGGARRSYGWNARIEKVRVWDPRNFEFEISIPNLLFILKECDASKGKGLVGEFVYAWDGTELILLPVGCPEYKLSTGFTELQGQKVKARELILGATYTTKQQKDVVYVGRFLYYETRRQEYRHPVGTKAISPVPKKYVFHDGSHFMYLNDLNQISRLHSDHVDSSYADLVEQFQKGQYGSPIKRLYLEERPETKTRADSANWHTSETWAYQDTDGAYITCQTREDKDWQTNEFNRSVETHNRHRLEDGLLIVESYSRRLYPPGKHPKRQSYGYSYRSYDEPIYPWVEPTTNRLLAELESGSHFKVRWADLEPDIQEPEKVEVTVGHEDEDGEDE